MEEIVWAKKKRRGGIFWPAKIVEEHVRGQKLRCVYKFNGKKWGDLIENEVQTLKWDCEDKDDHIQAGKSLINTKQQSLFSVACQKAEEQLKASIAGSEKTPEKSSKRKGHPEVKRTRATTKKAKLQLSDQNHNHVVPNSSGGSSSKHSGLHIYEENKDCDDSEDDNDNDLPDPFSPIEKPPEKMEKGNVVWAKYKDEPYWPSIFHSMDKKRKIWVYFFDETWKIQDMKRIVSPVKDVIPFNCGQERLDIIMKEGTSLDHEEYGKERFLQSVGFAEEYLASKASGKITNFFIYESEDDMSFDDSATPERDQKSFEMKTRKSKTRTFKELIANQPKYLGTPRERYKDLLTAIGKTRPTLTKILAEEIDCTRHNIFKNGAASQKNMLKHQSGYGPIDDDSIADRLLKKLIKWYSACDNCNDFNAVTYVSEVWLPEAIILGLMDSRQITRKEAEKIFGGSQ